MPITFQTTNDERKEIRRIVKFSENTPDVDFTPIDKIMSIAVERAQRRVN